MLASFYRAVVQAILLYESEVWVLLASMGNRIGGMHTEFLQMITGKIENQLGDETWETPGSEGIQEAAVTQLYRIYIERQQATVEQWGGIRPLFKLCTRETGYEGGGQRRKVW